MVAATVDMKVTELKNYMIGIAYNYYVHAYK